MEVMEVTNEMGVIVQFAQMADEAGFEILSIQAAYPDAIVSKGSQRYRAEFEFESRNFLYHRHDPRQCDIVICWEHNCPDLILPVIELSNDNWDSMEIILPTEQQRELAYWKYRATVAEAQLKIARRDLNLKDETDYQDCPICGKTGISNTVQAMNAHQRFCLEQPTGRVN